MRAAEQRIWRHTQDVGTDPHEMLMAPTAVKLEAQGNRERPCRVGRGPPGVLAARASVRQPHCRQERGPPGIAVEFHEQRVNQYQA
jgi:hypothetical protein